MIRTADSLTTMPDFESGAFDRALPPLPSVTHQLLCASSCVPLGANGFTAVMQTLLNKSNGKGVEHATPGYRAARL